MRYLVIITLLIMALAVTACSKAEESPPAPANETAQGAGEASPAEAEIPTAVAEPADEPMVESADEPADETDTETRSGPTGATGSMETPPDTMGDMTWATAMPQDSMARSPEMSEGSTSKHGGGKPPTLLGTPPWGNPGWRPPRRPPELKAGEVDDNADWQKYLQFVEDYAGPPVHETELEDRQVVTVIDRNGSPVPNAVVTLSQDGKEIARNLTYADGRTMLFPGSGETKGMTMKGMLDGGEYTISVNRDGFTNKTGFTLEDSGQGGHEIKLGGTMDYGAQVPLDVLFLLDSTGSMADEIRQIKNTLHSIAEQVSRLQANPDLRFGMVSYRDRGDEYVARLYDFDGNVARFQRSIREVQADGGSDYPESLNQALHEAVNDAGWREDGVRLVFLIADAPPHLDYPQDEDYAVEMVRARQAGIKVFSVASSGLDDQGERVFRQIAQQTMGRFLFILYQTGPQGSLETPHDVEQYSVDQLDSLIVKLIEDELAPLSAGEKGAMSMM